MTVNMVSSFAVILYSQLLSPPVILFSSPKKLCFVCKEEIPFFLNLGGLVRKIIETKKQLEASGTQQTKRTQVSFKSFTTDITTSCL